MWQLNSNTYILSTTFFANTADADKVLKSIIKNIKYQLLIIKQKKPSKTLSKNLTNTQKN